MALPPQKRLTYDPPSPAEISGLAFEEATVEKLRSIVSGRVSTSRPTDIVDGEKWSRLDPSTGIIYDFRWREKDGPGDGTPLAAEMSSDTYRTDTNIAATVFGVKKAYDKGAEGLLAAQGAQTTANTARTEAGAAQTTANTAVSKADAAQSTADSAVISAAAITGFPVGGLLMCANNVPPLGFLLCDGSSLNTSAYTKLFSAIGYVYGGSGSIFRLPDYRGYFLRGLGGNSASLGQAQTDAIRNIKGQTGYIQFGENWGFANGAFYLDGNQGRARVNGAEYEPRLNFDASRVVPTANENRPINKSVLICIKY